GPSGRLGGVRVDRGDEALRLRGGRLATYGGGQCDERRHCATCATAASIAVSMAARSSDSTPLWWSAPSSIQTLREVRIPAWRLLIPEPRTLAPLRFPVL